MHEPKIQGSGPAQDHMGGPGVNADMGYAAAHGKDQIHRPKQEGLYPKVAALSLDQGAEQGCRPSHAQVEMQGPAAVGLPDRPGGGADGPHDAHARLGLLEAG